MGAQGWRRGGAGAAQGWRRGARSGAPYAHHLGESGRGARDACHHDEDGPEAVAAGRLLPRQTLRQVRHEEAQRGEQVRLRQLGRPVRHAADHQGDAQADHAEVVQPGAREGGGLERRGVPREQDEPDRESEREAIRVEEAAQWPPRVLLPWQARAERERGRRDALGLDEQRGRYRGGDQPAGHEWRASGVVGRLGIGDCRRDHHAPI